MKFYEFFMDLLLAIYRLRYGIDLKGIRRAARRIFEGGLAVAATVIFELLCLAALAFLLRFLFAMHKEARPKSQHQVVVMPVRHRKSGGASSNLALKAIVGGRGRFLRRVG